MPALSKAYLMRRRNSRAVLHCSPGTVRTTAVVVSGLFLFLLVGGGLNDFLGSHIEFFERVNVVESVFQALGSRHGPFEVFTGSWMLIDV